MQVTIRHTPDCPNLEIARNRVEEALRSAGLTNAGVAVEAVADTEQAERLGFQGSPTILIDGVDPFALDTPAALACRYYSTPEGRDVAPSIEQLRDAIAAAAA